MSMPTRTIVQNALLRDALRWCCGIAAFFAAGAIIGVAFGLGVRAMLLTGGVLLFFALPGLGFTYVLLPPREEPLLRLALLLPFSMALQPLTVFFANRLLALPISVGTAVAVSGLLTVIGFALATLRWRRTRDGGVLPR